MKKKPKIVKPGRVKKVIQPVYPEGPEKVEIEVIDADHLYKEVRIDNTLEDEQGQERRLKEGAEVDVVIEADREATVPKVRNQKR